ncbi:MAG TPA: gliding motility-associated C-terminal domain-containing protein, partial [Chryseosolibacter sp.]
DPVSGCTDVELVNVGDNPPTVSISVVSVTDNTRCISAFNGAIDVTVTGATQFSWTGPGGFTASTADISALAPGAYTLTATDPVSGCTDVELVNVGDNPPTVSISVVSVTDNTRCISAFNGAIDVTVTGASQFSWTGPNGFTALTADISALEAGAYTLTATDPVSGCSDVEIINVGNNPPAITISVVSVTDNTTCVAPFDGAIDVTVTGATQFSWTGPNGFTAVTADISALEAGAYTLTATDPASGCTDTEIINVGINSPSISISVVSVTDNTRCVSAFNGAVDVTVTGATQFSWTGPGGFTASTADISALAPGTYTLTATNAVSGCTDVEIVNVGDNSPTVSINVVSVTDNSRCVSAFTGAINVTVSGATLFSWVGPNGFTAATEDIAAVEDGTYTLTATDPVSGCSAVEVVNVGSLRPTLSITATPTNSSCFGVNDGEIEVNTVTGGTGPYEFSIDGGTTFQASTIFPNIASGLYQVVARDIPTGCSSPALAVTVNATTAIIPTIGKLDASCNGITNGSITVSGVTGGAAPYEYSIDNGVNFQTSNTFTSLAGGSNHSVVVRDNNGCLSSAFSIVINNTATITATVGKVDVSSCVGNNGSITVTSPAGGTAPYMYSLNGGAFQASASFTALTPGAYNIVVRDNSLCLSAAIPVTIGTISNIVPVVTKVDASCNGVANGSITISSVTGGTGPYEYSINNGVTFGTSNTFTLLAGNTNHAVVVRDASGCLSSSIAIIINNLSSITASSIAKTDVSSCVGTNGQIVISGVTGGSGTYNFSVDNGTTTQGSGTFTNLTPGTYQVVISDAAPGGCVSAATTVTIGVIGNIVPVISKADAACNGVANGSITVSSVSGGLAPYEYSKDNGTTFQPSNVFNTLSAGTYSIVVRDAALCVSSVASIIIQNGVTITPAVNTTNVSCTGGDGVITIPSVSGGGAAPFTYSINNGTTFQASSTFNSVAQGVYSVVVKDNNGCLSAPVSASISSNCNGGGGGGGNINCTVFTVNVIESRPTCGGQDDGEITLTVTGGSPAPNYVLTLYDSVSTPIFTKSVVVAPGVAHKFDDLSASTTYFYQIQDGTNKCQLPYSLPLQTTVEATLDLASVTNATCFGSATGSAIINATGSQTGEYYYSVDNISWKLFVPGTPGQITDLPPLGTYNILVGEKIADVCHATVEVTINSINPDINATFSITPATCDGADGAITNIVASGGSGSGYQYSIDGQNFKTDNNFTGLIGGFYHLVVRDGGGCEKVLNANVTFPGFINFSYNVVDPTCANNGNSGALIVKVLDAGTYRVAVSEDQFNEPADDQYKNYSDPFITFDNLSRGTYFIYAKSNTAVCPTRSEPIAMQGAYALSFTVEPTCVANDLSLTLTNIAGEPGVPFEIRVYKKVTGVLVETIQRTAISATSTEFLEYQNHTFLRNADDYQLQMVQVNPVTGCQILSPLVDVNVPNEVFALVGPSKRSYPDIANGAIEVTNISGGAMPYEVRIELDSAASFNFPSFETNFEEPELNANSQFSKQYENIPPGRYIIQVRDNVGCVLELMGRVKMDQTVYIPNIFTPNGDNVNDLFFVRNLPADNVALIITSRWGKEVYSTKNYLNNWNGEGAADGVYFYQLSIAGSEPITGWVEILRGEKP